MVEVDRDSESTAEAVETLKEQRMIEGRVVGLFDEDRRKT